MASSTYVYRLIMLGNSGVGKSFLANCFLNDDNAFESRLSARSVTRLTEWKQMESQHDHRLYDVANIPGLIEANQSLVDQNRQEIVKALDENPSSIVVYVFGHRNGRIADEDLVAFHAITTAYTFRLDLLLLFINGIPSDHPAYYYDTIIDLLHRLTEVPTKNIFPIKQVIAEDEKEGLGRSLHEIISKAEPQCLKKKQSIVLIIDQIAELKRSSKRKQEEISALKQISSTALEAEDCNISATPQVFELSDALTTPERNKLRNNQQNEQIRQEMLRDNQQFEQQITHPDRQSPSSFLATKGKVDPTFMFESAQQLQKRPEIDIQEDDEPLSRQDIVGGEKQPSRLKRVGKYLLGFLPFQGRSPGHPNSSALPMKTLSNLSKPS